MAGWKRLIGIAVVSLLPLYIVVAVVRSWYPFDNIREARERGVAAAEKDIAAGVPWLQCSMHTPDGYAPDLTPEGLGIDRETGIPLLNGYFWCGTGRDYAAEEAFDEAYNTTIRSAVHGGRLDRFRLHHKLRTRAQAEALLSLPTTRLAKSGDKIVTANGRYTFEYSEDDVSSGAHILPRPDRSSEYPYVRFAYTHEDRPNDDGYSRFVSYGRGPMEAVLADDDTSVVMRDADGGIWTIDLPRSIVVQWHRPPQAR